jgi:hypothetical protein
MTQLQIARQGWGHISEFELCTNETCEFRDSHPNHVYSVIDTTTPHIHICMWFDLKAEVITCLTINQPSL